MVTISSKNKKPNQKNPKKQSDIKRQSLEIAFFAPSALNTEPRVDRDLKKQTSRSHLTRFVAFFTSFYKNRY